MYITANGQKVGKPATTNELLNMVDHAWAYQHMERKKVRANNNYMKASEIMSTNFATILTGEEKLLVFISSH